MILVHPCVCGFSCITMCCTPHVSRFMHDHVQDSCSINILAALCCTVRDAADIDGAAILHMVMYKPRDMWYAAHGHAWYCWQCDSGMCGKLSFRSKGAFKGRKRPHTRGVRIIVLNHPCFPHMGSADMLHYLILHTFVGCGGRCRADAVCLTRKME